MTTTPERDAPASAGTTLRAGGLVLGAGALAMIVGAIVRQTTGTDLDAALTEGRMADYLAEAAAVQTALFLNLSLWILGAFLLGVGGYLLSRVTDNTPSSVAGAGYLIGPALAITAFVTWMALLRLTGTDPGPAIADALGFISSRVDWIATVLLVGLGPLLLSVGGRRTWVPGWLYGLGLAGAAAGLLTIVAMYTGALNTYGFLIVPIGLVWVISASVVAIRVGSAGP